MRLFVIFAGFIVCSAALPPIRDLDPFLFKAIAEATLHIGSIAPSQLDHMLYNSINSGTSPGSIPDEWILEFRDNVLNEIDPLDNSSTFVNSEYVHDRVYIAGDNILVRAKFKIAPRTRIRHIYSTFAWAITDPMRFSMRFNILSSRLAEPNQCWLQSDEYYFAAWSGFHRLDEQGFLNFPNIWMGIQRLQT